MAQLTFSDVEMGMGRKRETRRSRFLDRLSKSCPWDAWLALVREARGTDAGARGPAPRWAGRGSTTSCRRACTWRGSASASPTASARTRSGTPRRCAPSSAWRPSRSPTPRPRASFATRPGAAGSARPWSPRPSGPPRRGGSPRAGAPSRAPPSSRARRRRGTPTARGIPTPTRPRGGRTGTSGTSSGWARAPRRACRTRCAWTPRAPATSTRSPTSCARAATRLGRCRPRRRREGAGGRRRPLPLRCRVDRRQEALAGRRGRPGRRGRQVGRPQRRRARLPLGQGHIRAAEDAL